MKQRQLSIFRRLAIVIFSLIAILGFVFIIITYLATTYYHQASTQLLNKDIAAHIAKFTSPFNQKGINKQKADSVFQNAMILSPSAEVYFLDKTGKVIYFDAPANEIKGWTIPLSPIKQFIATNGKQYIKDKDPKEPDHSKIFSAAEVLDKDKSLGYIYVILGSKKSENITELLFNSHILSLAIQTFIIILLLSYFFSFLYLKRTRDNFQQMIAVLERFESGDYDARFNLKQQEELLPVKHAFNKMADLLSAAISKLTRSELERKNFTAMFSHDLRTSLSIAMGYTETLLLEGENKDISREEQTYYSQLIYNKLLQIENMVKKLLELSKMDAPEFKPQKEPFVLSEIAQECINTFQLIAAEKKIDLKCTQFLYHVWINADINMMERVIQNLVDNAIKATPEGGKVQISIEVEINYLTFKIENTGNPLPGDLLHWINTNNEEGEIFKKRPARSGLGLVIVQRILFLHDLSLLAYSESGLNVFTFKIPIVTP